MSEVKLMKCGHTSNATDENGNPVCLICVGIKKGAEEIAEYQPDLKNREAKCMDCGKKVNSELNLPFFEHKPESEYDRFYCGCRGWG